MRRSRRGRSSSREFGGSGEDSFVAVVVTKLTGALLFILLLTMVIMALIPRAAENRPKTPTSSDPVPLEIVTPQRLPEAVAGRPYQLALAARGGSSATHWSLVGDLPDGLEFDGATGQVRGTPKTETSQPLNLIAKVSDAQGEAHRSLSLTVLKADSALPPPPPAPTPLALKPAIPPLPLREWLQHGFGFLLLILAHLVGMNTIAALQRWSAHRHSQDDDAAKISLQRRFSLYRWTTRLATLGLMAALGLWLWKPEFLDLLALR